MKKRIIIGVLIVALLGGGFYMRRRAARAARFTSVKISTVEKGELKSYLSTTGLIESKNSKDYFGQQLKVSKVNVKVGDNVKKGQVLVTFDMTDLANSVTQAQLQYNNALLQRQDLLNQRDSINNKIADLDKQIDELKAKNVRNQLEESNLKSLQASRDNIQTISDEKVKQQDNSVSLAKLAYDTAKAKAGADKENIIADFDGVVTAVNVVEGAVASPAQPAVTIQDLSSLKAVVAVGKYDAAKINVGQAAEIDNGGKTYEGKVSFIDPVAEKSMSSSGTETTLNTEIDILGNTEGLKVNFDADVNILLGEKSDVTKVPAEAIRSDKNGNTYVFVVEGNKAVEKDVQLGLQSDMEAEVLEGLKSGDKIILNPSSSITTGTLVKEGTDNSKGR